MPMERARMAVWLLSEPSRVIMPSKSDLLRRTVSDGVRSFATRMQGSVPCRMSPLMPKR